MKNELLTAAGIATTVSTALVFWVKASLTKLEHIPKLISVVNAHKDVLGRLDKKIEMLEVKLAEVEKTITRFEGKIDYLIEKQAERSAQFSVILSKVEDIKEAQILDGSSLKAAWREIERMRECDR